MITVRISPDPAGDQIRDLHKWLRADVDLRGTTRIDGRPPQPGEMGVTADVLVAALAPGGVAVALVTGVVGWLRARPRDVSLRMTRQDGSELEITVPMARSLQPKEVGEMIGQVAAWTAEQGPLPALPQDPAVPE
jgi:hypothetical protein